VDERQQPGSDEYAALPAEDVTIDQVIAWNMRYWRLASFMTQEEFGRRIGWSAANVSAAERSVEEHRDRRRFDAQTIAEIAEALRLPIGALFLPPADDGQGRRYQWHQGGKDPAPRDMASLMRLAMLDNDHETEVMEDYKDRFRGAVTAYLDEEWGEEVGTWFAPVDDKEARAEQAARFRSRQATLLRMAAEDGELAEFLERPREGRP
jgi:transcriptional regulator with XRE-family HTH domain